MMKNNRSIITIGRRKSSVARVRFIKGKGKILINNRELIDYFKRESLVMELKQPLDAVEFDNKYDITLLESNKYETNLIKKLQDTNLKFICFQNTYKYHILLQ